VVGLVAAAMLIPDWANEIMDVDDPFTYTNATVDFEYGIYKFGVFSANTEELREEIMNRYGVGTWNTHCNSSRFSERASLVKSEFCGGYLNGLKLTGYAVIVLALFCFAPVLFGMGSHERCNPFGPAWTGLLWSGLQLIGLVFMETGSVWLLEDYWKSEARVPQVLASGLTCKFFTYFLKPCNAQLGMSWYMGLVALILTLIQVYLYAIMFMWARVDPSKWAPVDEAENSADGHAKNKDSQRKAAIHRHYMENRQREQESYRHLSNPPGSVKNVRANPHTRSVRKKKKEGEGTEMI